MSRLRPIIRLRPLIRAGGARDMFRCRTHPSLAMLACGCSTWSSLTQAVPKSQVVILHTRPWLSLLAELSDTVPGYWTSAQRGGYCPQRNTKAMGRPLGVVQECPGGRIEKESHEPISFWATSTWPGTPFFPFHLLEPVTRYPQPKQTSEHVCWTTDRAELSYPSSRPPRPSSRPQCPRAGLSEAEG